MKSDLSERCNSLRRAPVSRTPLTKAIALLLFLLLPLSAADRLRVLVWINERGSNPYGPDGRCELAEQDGGLSGIW